MDQANNLKEFKAILNRYKAYNNVFYRGQAEKYKTINASISRDQGYSLNEHKIYHESIQLKSKEFEKFSSPIERLAKLQHYGVPTRLIDVTVDPLIALYFAVENVEDKCSGIVYLYIQPSKCLDSKHVKLLSLIATIEDYHLTNIQKSYQKLYNEEISEFEIVNLVQETSFVEFSDNLKEANPRLYSQSGTFAICGNDVKDGEIQKQIKSLDSIKPTLKILIPYEYKLAIKEELDQYHLINVTTIYPELPSVADYIREKYKKRNISIDGTYSVMDVDDFSYPGVRRISIKITLNKLLRIEEIHAVVKSIIEDYRQSHDVITVYVAKDGNDFIMYNWILRGQWIRPSCDNVKMSPLKETDGTGYSWQEGQSYSVRADFYSKYIFEDDKTLFIYNEKTFQKTNSIFEELFVTFHSESFSSFLSLVDKYKEEIRNLSILNGDFGVSVNKEFNDDLMLFTEFIQLLDDVAIWSHMEHLNLQQKQFQIGKKLNSLRRQAEDISARLPIWLKELDVSAEDYERIDPYNRIEQPQFNFEPTIPISPHALIVDFNIEVHQKTDKTLWIFGSTNLYDDANLLLTIRKKSGQICGQNKATVNKGKFDFGIFSIKGKGYELGDYVAEITLSVPTTQPKLFQEKSGIEYENLDGPYVERDGIGPTVNFEKQFTVK